MRKIVCLLTFVIICSASYAQFNRGRMLVGGSLGFHGDTYKTKNNNTTTTTQKNVSFSLTPQFGYFIIDNLAIGAGIDLSSTSVKYPNNNNYKDVATSFQFQPFVRYYLPVKVFFQGTVGVGASKDKVTNNNNVTTVSKSGISSLSLGVGYAWFLNDHVAVEPFVGYLTQRTKPDGSSVKYNESDLFLKIGFQIYLGK
jgi:outer membrane protein